MKDREYGNTVGEIQNWFSREVQLYNLSEINPFSINDLIYTCPFNDDIFKHYCPEVVSIVQTRAQSILHDATYSAHIEFRALRDYSWTQRVRSIGVLRPDKLDQVACEIWRILDIMLHNGSLEVGK